METNKFCITLCFLLLYFTMATISFTPCDARKSITALKGRKIAMKQAKKLKVMKHLDGDVSIDSSNTDPYLSSPFSLPPFDSLGPISLPDFAPPFCTLPPFTPQPPSTTIPTPALPPPPPPFYYIPPILPITQSPPLTPTGPPQTIPSPPTSTGPPQTIPSPPTYMLSPPYYEPSPPSYYFPSPSYVPYPGGFAPSPPVFQPPVVYPPPTGPPPRNTAPSLALWCVAKPSVPDPIIQEAMNYACGSGADCESIQPNSACFEPNTLFAHASYAFNSYWQRTKVAGGTCSFGGTAMLVTVDPSYDGCHFLYY